jgi:GDP-L-fucose synthase
MIPPGVLQAFHGARVLVTGGTGLIGRQIVARLVAAGAQVRSVSLDDLRVDPRAEHLKGDLSDFGLCKQLTRDTDFVFHVAGIKGSVDVTRARPASFFVPLLMMNTNVLEACRLNQVRKVVYTSSIGAYPSGELFVESSDLENQGPPMDTYPGWAKRMAELQVQAYRAQYGLENFAVVRPCNVYGPGDNFDPANAMVIPSLMARVHGGENPLVVFGDGSAVRDFAFSRDVADGVILALHHGTGGGYVNLGSGAGCTIRELVETLSRVTPFAHRFDASRPSGFSRRVMDIALARARLGYQPATTLEQGLRETWQWYLQNQDEHLRKQNYFRA